MGYYSSTKLSCTRPELIASGSTFNQNTESELLEVKDGKALYRTWKSSMHNEIEELSRLYPEETFTITWWWNEDYFTRILWTGVFINGKYKEVKEEPGYSFFQNDVGSVDKELINRFQDVLMKYVERINIVREDPDEGTIFDIINDQNFFDDDFRSHFQIIWENKEHKFTGTNKDGFIFDIKYEMKDPESQIQDDYPKEKHTLYTVYGPVPF